MNPDRMVDRFRSSDPRPDKAIAKALKGFGGILRCEECLRTEPLGNPGQRTTGGGWPTCHGYTMRWWTQRQIDAGEMTP